MSTSATVRKEALKVPGATLYYEIRGAGPVLLMMPGGPADARIFQKVGDHLANDFTVVTYDPRGLSRSTLEEPLDESRIVQIFADDVHHLLEATVSAPSFVYASSGGATIALDLVARYGPQVQALVAHEPPSPWLQADPERARAEMLEVSETLRTQGLHPAMMKFAAASRIRMSPPPPVQNPTPEEREGMEQMGRNMYLFLGPYIDAIANFKPDFDAIRNGPTRVTAGVGTNSVGEMAHDCGLRLGELLGRQALVFPGAHGGFEEYPVEFAAQLRQVFGK